MLDYGKLIMPDYPEKFAEIDGRIFLQAQLLMPQGNNPELSKVISILVFNVQHKLKAMLYHKGIISKLRIS